MSTNEFNYIGSRACVSVGKGMAFLSIASSEIINYIPHRFSDIAFSEATPHSFQSSRNHSRDTKIPTPRGKLCLRWSYPQHLHYLKQAQLTSHKNKRTGNSTGTLLLSSAAQRRLFSPHPSLLRVSGYFAQAQRLLSKPSLLGPKETASKSKVRHAPAPQFFAPDCCTI